MRCSRNKENYGPTYGPWCNMRKRCLAKGSKNYDRYGGRGIAICDEWMSYAAFKQWALESGYEPGLTIDRIDNDGHYCPENCRWIAGRENARMSTDIRKKDGKYALTYETASELKKLAATGEHTDRALAKMFGVSLQTANNVVRGRCWADAEPQGPVFVSRARRLTDDEKFRIAILADVGDKPRHIRELFGVVESTIYKLRDRFRKDPLWMQDGPLKT